MSNIRRRILHICLSESWGGLEMAVLRWNEILEKHGHKNFNIVTPNTKLAHALKEEKFPTLEWDSDTYISPIFTYKVSQFVRQWQADVVILQNLRDIWLITPALWGKRKVQFVGFTQMMLNYKKTDFLHRTMYSRLDHLCVLTNYQRRALLPFLPVPDRKYRVIPNFVDTKKFTPRKRSEEVRAKMGYTEHDFVVGCVGRLDPQKGQRELIRAFPAIRKRYLNAKLLLVGDPTHGEESIGYNRTLHDEVKKLDIEDHVQFIPFQPNVEDIMPSLDLFVLPSYQETFGYVVVEAMASGVPIVATNAGGVPEILGKGRFGVLCEPRSAEGLYDAMSSLIHDSQHRSKLAKAALEHVRYTYDKEQVYQSLMKVLNRG